MLCEKCGKNNAVTHIRQNINGVQSESYLCESCAADITGKLGGEYSKLFSDFGFGIDSMLGSIFGQDFLTENLIAEPEKRCKMCGSTISSIKKTGNVGCAECYSTFKNELMPLIQRIHGKTAHSGRGPALEEEKKVLIEKIGELENKLKEAIDSENFEAAVKIRDELKELKGQI